MKSSVRKRLAIGLLAVGTVVLAASISQAAIILDLRAIPAGTVGATVVGPKAVIPTNPSGIVKLQLWGMVTNTDGNNSNDGFRQTHASVLSRPGAINLSGNLAVTSNIAPFNGLGAQLGTQTDLDADGDLDIGDLRTTGSDIMRYFIASTGASPVMWDAVPDSAKAAEGGFSSFLLGTADFSFNALPPGGAVSVLTVIPRVRTDGLTSARQLHVFVQDGQMTALEGTNPGVVRGFDVIVGVPEPSTWLLAPFTLLAVLLFRNRRCRPSVTG